MGLPPGVWVGISVVGVVTVVALVLTFGLNGSNSGCRWPDGFSPPSPPAAGDTPSDGVPLEVLVSAELKDDPEDATGEPIQTLFRLNTRTAVPTTLVAGAAPTISPDRRQVLYLVSKGEIREPWILDVGDPEGRRFLREPERCPSASRAAWNQSGTLVSFVCENESEEALEGIQLFRQDGQFHSLIPTPGLTDSLGATTWIGDDALVYSQRDDDDPDRSTLWLVTEVDDDAEQVQLTFGGENGSDVNPDWSPERASLLFLHRPDPEDPIGTIWTCSPQEDAKQWGSGDSFAAPAWSPDGESIAFLDRSTEETRLTWAPLGAASEPDSWKRLPPQALDGVPLAPAWGSR